MKKLKNILKIFIIALIAFYLFPLTSNAELTEEQQKKVANFAKCFVEEGNNKKILRYSQAQAKRLTGFNNKKYSDGNMYFDCSAFACFVYNQTCKAQLPCLNTATIYTSGKFKNIGKYSSNRDKLEKGDLLCRPRTQKRGGHVVVYVGDGKVAHASTGNATATEQVKISDVTYYRRSSEDMTILRYKGSPSKVKGYDEYTWPDGTQSNWKDEDMGGSTSESSSGNSAEDYEYQGTQEGTFNLQTYDIDWLINCLKEILDWNNNILN